MNVLELKNVCKSYGDFHLQDISFSLPEGCIMGLIGENGAGKSTTIKLIFDLIKRDSGSVMLWGQEVDRNATKLKNEVGVVLDESCFPEVLKVKNVGQILKNIYPSWDKQLFEKYLEDFKLPHNKAIKAFSKGMKMKLSIAAALSHNPRLLVLDEATSGLDPIVRDEILDVFLDFISDGRNSVLISSHITSDLEKICDYITFIHQGKMLISEEKDQILENYGILKCSKEDFSQIIGKVSKSDILGYQEHSFGVEALVKRDTIKGNHVIDRVRLEDIMLYQVKDNIKHL